MPCGISWSPEMAAPTIQLTVNQHTTTAPGQLTSVTCGMSRMVVTAAADWTASGSGTNEYYYDGSTTGAFASLSSNTQYRPRLHQLNGNTPIVKYRSGTLGSLATYGYGFGDNDTLGADTLYLRMGDGGAPVDNEIVLIWDETDAGDSNPTSACTVEWWLDLTDGDTATAVASWDNAYRYVTDPRTGATIDMAGSAPDSSKGSPIRGWVYNAILPVGTLSLKCRVTNSDGDQTTATQSITVTNTTRNVVNIAASGGDYTTLAAYETNDAENDLVIIEDGHTETISSQLNIAANGVHIQFAGSATMTMTDVIQVRGNYVTIEGNDNVSWKSTGNGTNAAFETRRCDGFALIGGTFTGDSSTQVLNTVLDLSYFNWNTAHYGLLIQGITLDVVKTYTISGSTNRIGVNDVSVIGCDMLGDTGIASAGPSVNESVLRDVVKLTCQTVLYNSIRELSKDALRFTNMEHGTVYGNYFLDGQTRFGESGEESHKAYECRFDSNYSRRTVTGSLAQFDMKPGGEGIYAVNNIFSMEVATETAIGGAGSPGTDTTYYAGYREHADVFWLHNTVFITGDSSNSAAAINGSGSGDSTYVSNFNIERNHVLTGSGYAGTAVVANGATATNNTAEAGTLDSNLSPSVAPDACTTEAGVLYDFHNNLRAATSFEGATQQVSAPTVANLTPADNATGVSTAQTISMQFSEDMKAGTGTIELRQVSDDSVLDSISAADATINISDRTQVTLTGLALTGVSGDVYVYIPDGAFLSRSSDVPFAGYTTNTDWNFTVGAATGGMRARDRSRLR